ncbi:MAG: MBL fold metallo-hydrolase [Candidatus Altiarchaeales archaeon]|nr:MBL fold metallo-hydrolase [Candidatus Altiarchaeales archaeon]
MSQKLPENIIPVGVVDWDRRLFDELIPLPEGTSYNSYLIEGSKKTVLIDTVDPSKVDEFLGNLRETGLKHIDYVVANHAEQDHSGSLPALIEEYPDIKVVASQKCKGILSDLLHLRDDDFKVVQDADTLSLGDRTLEFIEAPWVHWPETILTYVREEGVLFSCDLFGSHLAQDGLYVEDECRSADAAKRYYAEIMMPFRGLIKKHMQRLKDYEIKVIATSHGPIYDKPEFILNLYENWVSDDVEQHVLIPYVSMHGSIRESVEYFMERLAEEKVKATPFNLTVTDIGRLAEALVDASTVVFATPTVLFGPHPKVAYAAYLANILNPKTKYVSIINSYGWGGQCVEILGEFTKKLDAELIDPVEFKGKPDKRDFMKIDKLVENIISKHKTGE